MSLHWVKNSWFYLAEIVAIGYSIRNILALKRMEKSRSYWRTERKQCGNKKEVIAFNDAIASFL